MPNLGLDIINLFLETMILTFRLCCISCLSFPSLSLTHTNYLNTAHFTYTPLMIIYKFQLLYFNMCVMCVSRSVVPDSLRPHGVQPTKLLSPWDFPGKDTGVGHHFFLQGIFPTQGSNPGLLHCRQILYQLRYKVSPYFQTKWIIASTTHPS